MTTALFVWIASRSATASEQAVRSVSFDVSSGESIAILGATGCGKTTILRLIAGLERPDEGDIWIEGRQVASAGRNIVASYERGVGLVFQRSRAVAPFDSPGQSRLRRSFVAQSNA